jgi:pyruvate dehydrogenase (quinone)
MALASASDMPTIIEVKTDPEVPPMPPHFTFKQMQNFVASTARDPERGSVLLNTARQVLGGS